MVYNICIFYVAIFTKLESRSLLMTRDKEESEEFAFFEKNTAKHGLI